MRCAAGEHSCYRALQCLLGACCTTAAQASVSLFYVTLQSRARLLPRTFSLCCVAEQTVVGGRPIVQGRVFTNVLRGPGGWRMAGPSGFVVESLYQPVGGLRLSLRGGLGVLVFGVLVVGTPAALQSGQLCLSCLCTPVRELARGGRLARTPSGCVEEVEGRLRLATEQAKLNTARRWEQQMQPQPQQGGGATGEVNAGFIRRRRRQPVYSSRRIGGARAASSSAPPPPPPPRQQERNIVHYKGDHRGNSTGAAHTGGRRQHEGSRWPGHLQHLLHSPCHAGKPSSDSNSTDERGTCRPRNRPWCTNEKHTGSSRACESGEEIR